MIDLVFIDVEYRKKFNDISEAMYRCMERKKFEMAAEWSRIRTDLLQNAVNQGEYKARNVIQLYFSDNCSYRVIGNEDD